MNYLIEHPSELTELKPLIDDLKNRGGVVGVDTEFLREKTYRAKLCLMQLAIGEHQYCIDVLALEDVQILHELMAANNIVKIFHASSQDLEVIYQTFDVLPHPIFDTQLAAAFCGSDLQQGYSAMVEQRLGIELVKSQARTDWSRRPLTEKQIEYAGLDVEYLHELMSLIEADLDACGRRAWYEQEILSYSDPEPFDESPAKAWRRVSGGHLKLRQQYALRDLAIWREQQAQQKNIPRSWILRDDKLYDLVQRNPKTAQEIIDAGSFGRRSSAYLAPKALEVLRSVKVGDQPLWLKSEPLTKAEKSICSAAMKELGVIAQELNIAQALLATRKDIEYLFRHRQSKRLMQGWRKEIVGDVILDFIRGQES